jgi:hypothetical protein
VSRRGKSHSRSGKEEGGKSELHLDELSVYYGMQRKNASFVLRFSLLPPCRLCAYVNYRLFTMSMLSEYLNVPK